MNDADLLWNLPAEPLGERDQRPPRVIAVVGPTATGKTALGIEIAERVGGEVINADALQVYRGMDIGTAKPTAEERARIPHHLIDILDPEERYSAGEFARRAQIAMEEIAGRGKWPIVVGGSGLYLKALLEGLSPMPPRDLKVREELELELATEGLPAMVEKLRQVDPPTAARLLSGDTQRVLRALEVERSSGRPLSAWIADQPMGQEPLPALKIGLTLPRKLLYDRIDQRVDLMEKAGWVQEIRELLEAGHSASAPAFQAIGYRQLIRYLRGKWSLTEALSDTMRTTRRFAKRQITWFRKEHGLHWIPAQRLEPRLSQILSEISPIGDRRGSHGET
ncbi:MAG: tRNA (adenosine(37)-N6)-dimethylallyltransferase MiaA [Acidobacteriota bacterium]